MRILSLDGGGYLGLGTAAFIAEAERHFQTTCHEQFDLFCGTSTGAIIALALASGKTGREVVELYRTFGATVFKNPFPGARSLRLLRGAATSLYSNGRLRDSMRDAFGDVTLGDLRQNGKFVLIPAYNLTAGRPRIFKTNHSPELTLDDDYLVRDIALASAAAPIFLPIVSLLSPTSGVEERFCDGGLFANCPALLGYAEAVSYLKAAPEAIQILSLSTPRTSLAERSSAQSWLERTLLSRGVLVWGPRLTNVMIDATSTIMHFALLRIMEAHSSTGAHYERIELPRPEGVALDIATQQATETLQQIGSECARDTAIRRLIRPFFVSRRFIMANVQKQFEEFHKIIRTDYEMNATLREKRDIILDRIHNYLVKNGLPDFERVSQGSYKMKTGVVPIEDLEYDIDVGLRFPFAENDYTAKEVRKWIFEAVKGHTETVEEKGPCIRVTYADGYHVDLVMYACWPDDFGEAQYRLAHKTRGWVPANPIKLVEHVNNAREVYEGTEDNATKTDQFRRSTRDLRRWNDVAIPYEDRGKPTGLALVLLAIKHLQPALTWDGKSDDRLALERMAWAAANTFGRIVAEKPTPEYEDMFGRLSDKQMNELKDRFRILYETLVAADKEKDPRKACQLLAEVFGDDFPVPPEEETADRTRGPAIITTSVSA